MVESNVVVFAKSRRAVYDAKVRWLGCAPEYNFPGQEDPNLVPKMT